MASDRSSPNNVIFYDLNGPGNSGLRSLIRINIILTPKVFDLNPSGADVPIDTPISITFNKPMIKSVTENNISIVPITQGDFIWEENKLIFTTTEKLDYDTEYIIHLSKNTTDVDGLNLDEDYQWSFDTEKPEVEKDDNENSENTFNITFKIILIIILLIGIGILFKKRYER